MTDHLRMTGRVRATVTGPDGTVKHRCDVHNLITDVGAQYYAGRAALASSLPDQVTGMQLGTDDTAPAGTGTGAAIVAYLSGSAHDLDSGYPTATGGEVTWQASWAAGEATSASAVTEVALVTQAVATDSAAPASATIARALLSNIPSIGAQDTLKVTWTHTLAVSS